MNRNEIQVWLHYWRNAKMLDTKEIKTQGDVAKARSVCPFMDRTFANVSDHEIWHAIEADRMLADRCRIHAGKMDGEGWYVTANVLNDAAAELERLRKMAVFHGLADTL